MRPHPLPSGPQRVSGSDASHRRLQARAGRRGLSPPLSAFVTFQNLKRTPSCACRSLLLMISEGVPKFVAV